MTDTISLSGAAMQRAAAEVADEFPEFLTSPVTNEQKAWDNGARKASEIIRRQILALSAPSPEALMAEAVKLPEVRALIEALQAANARFRILWGHGILGNGIASTELGYRESAAALAPFTQETRHDAT